MEVKEIADKLKGMKEVKSLVNPNIEIHALGFEEDKTIDKYLGIIEFDDKKNYYNVVVDKENVNIKRINKKLGEDMYKHHKECICNEYFCYINEIDTSSGWSVCKDKI